MRTVSIAVLAGVCGLCGCGGPTAATITMHNDFPSTAFTLCRVAYSDHTWTAAITPGTSAPPLAVTAASSYAYALAVYGSTDCANPASLPIVLRLKTPFESTPGGTFTIDWNFATHTGKCGTPPLTQAEYDTIRITSFPGVAAQAYADVFCP